MPLESRHGRKTSGRPRLRFDLDNRFLEPWLKVHGAQSISDLPEETRRTIRSVLVETARRGGHPSEVARRIAGLVDLTAEQTLAVEALIAQALQSGMSEMQARKKAEAFAASLRKERARLIARTEMLRAANAAQESAVQQAYRAGWIDPAITKRVWIAALDSKTCPICAAMAGVEVGFHELFQTPVGPLRHPPAHPGCRCSWGLRVEVPP